MEDPRRRPRPASGTRPGPPAAVAANDSVLWLDDPESMREKQRALRAARDALRREGLALRAELRGREAQSLMKDGLLHEMLSTRVSGPGSGGERFDQLREDLQVCLQLKRAVHEARGCLDGAEQREADCKEELKGGADKIRDLEKAIEEAKRRAKAKADAWVEVNSGDRETECFAQSQRDQRVARRLQEQLLEAESGASKAQQDVNRISRDMAKRNEEARSVQAKMEQLGDKIQVVSAQIAELQGALQAEGDRAHLASERGELEKECASLDRQIEREHAEVVRAEAANANSGRGLGWEVEAAMLLDSFSLLPPDARSETVDLLERLRAVIASSSVSVLEVLLAESARADGWLNAEELSSGLARLRLPGASVATARQLIDSVHPGVAAHGQVGVVGLVLALSKQRGPAARPVDGDGPELLGARLRWACWRRGKPEGDVRSRLASVLDAPSADIRLAARELCSELGLDEATAEALGESLERLRAGFCAALPPWRCLPSLDRASLLARFVEHLATYRDLLVPRLCGEMTLDDFLAVASELGDAWSRSDLTQVALLAERVPGAPPGEPPIVDGLRLARAAQPRGLWSEFEVEAKAASTQAVAACEVAADQPSRKATPKRRAELAPSGGARPEAAPRAPAPVGAPAEPSPPPPPPPPPAPPVVVLTSKGDGPGMYRVLEVGSVKELPVNAEASRTSAAVARLAPGTVMQVVELAEQLDGGRRRARITQPAGWVTLANEESGFRFAERFGEPPPSTAPAAASQAPVTLAGALGAPAVVPGAAAPSLAQVPAAPSGALGAQAVVPGATAPSPAQVPAVPARALGAQAGVPGAAASLPAQALSAATGAPSRAPAPGVLGVATSPSAAQGIVSALKSPAASPTASPRAVSFACEAEAVVRDEEEDDDDNYSEEFDGDALSDESNA